MSKIETLGPDAPEFSAVDNDEGWAAWRANPITRRLAGWLQESLASAAKRLEEKRARAAESLDDPTGHGYAWARRDFDEINGGTHQLRQLLTLIAGIAPTAPAVSPPAEKVEGV